MPRVRPTMSLRAPLGRVDGPGQLNTHYVSTCKFCRLGIYKGQPHRWVRDPHRMGLWHDACVGFVAPEKRVET